MPDTLILKTCCLVADSAAKITYNIILNPANENMSSLLPNIITIFLALLAGLIALYQVKSNTISSSRITWIENLRESISSYCVEVSHCALLVENMIHDCDGKLGNQLTETIEKHYAQYVESSNKSNKLGTKVLLYLNSDEDSHKKIENLINIIQNHLEVEDMTKVDKLKIDDHIKEIIALSKTVFKKEWTKSKKIFKI